MDITENEGILSRSIDDHTPVVQPVKRKLNNIWAKLAEEETVLDMTNQLNEVQMDSAEWVRIERGPESFYIRKGAFPVRERKWTRAKRKHNNVKKNKQFEPVNAEKSRAKSRTTKLDTATVFEPEEGELSDSAESDSSLSSGGISDDEMELLRKRSMPKSEKKRKRSKKAKRADDFDYSMEDNFDDIIARMGETLKEENLSILRDIVQTVGIPAASKILNKVMKIERKGGLMVKDGTRRRTPGGVFLYLIKRHPKTKSDSLTQLIRSLNKKTGKQKKKRKNKIKKDYK